MALDYVNNNWSCIIEFLTDGQIPIDNNGAENAIRPFLTVRKNWLHSISVNGANDTAAIYSVFETGKQMPLILMVIWNSWLSNYHSPKPMNKSLHYYHGNLNDKDLIAWYKYS